MVTTKFIQTHWTFDITVYQ